MHLNNLLNEVFGQMLRSNTVVLPLSNLSKKDLHDETVIAFDDKKSTEESILFYFTVNKNRYIAKLGNMGESENGIKLYYLTYGVRKAGSTPDFSPTELHEQYPLLNKIGVITAWIIDNYKNTALLFAGTQDVRDMYSDINRRENIYFKMFKTALKTRSDAKIYSAKGIFSSVYIEGLAISSSEIIDERFEEITELKKKKREKRITPSQIKKMIVPKKIPEAEIDDYLKSNGLYLSRPEMKQLINFIEMKKISDIKKYNIFDLINKSKKAVII